MIIVFFRAANGAIGQQTFRADYAAFAFQDKLDREGVENWQRPSFSRQP